MLTRRAALLGGVAALVAGPAAALKMKPRSGGFTPLTLNGIPLVFDGPSPLTAADLVRGNIYVICAWGPEQRYKLPPGPWRVLSAEEVEL